MKPQSKSATSLPIQHFERQKDWANWLKENHVSSLGLWLKIAKNSADLQSISYDEAIEVALSFGWIDGQKHLVQDQQGQGACTMNRPGN